MAVFELLAYQRSSASISIGSFTLVNAPIVQTALPAIVAFLIYDGIRLIIRWLDLETAYIKLVKIYAEPQWHNDLDVFVKPQLFSLWNVGVAPSKDTVLKSEEFIRVANMVISGFLIFLLPVGFECQAYYRLIQKFGYHYIFVWISVAVTVLLSIVTAIYVVLNFSSSE